MHYLHSEPRSVVEPDLQRGRGLRPVDLDLLLGRGLVGGVVAGGGGGGGRGGRGGAAAAGSHHFGGLAAESEALAGESLAGNLLNR